MTHRLYYTDSYLTSFTARVTRRADDGRRVYLDQTGFYPTSGGQPHDLGRLGGIPVLDVVDEEHDVAHLLAEPLGAETVAGSIDWERRFDHMQQHTGQHLLSAVLADLFGFPTVSVHFGAQLSTLDLDAAELSPSQVREAERQANRVITENRPVRVEFEDARTATGLRKPSDREGTLRIVSIADLDRSACGGTHVRATGEIGALLIRKVERVRKQVRLEFLCGGRAAARARADFDLLSAVASGASAGVDEVPALFEKLRADLKDSDGQRKHLERELAGARARELYAAATVGPGGRRVIQITGSRESPELLREMAQALVALPGAVLVATRDEPPTILLAAATDTGLDAGQVLKPVLASAGGRGGGSARLAQGSVPGPEALEEVARQLAAAIGSA